MSNKEILRLQAWRLGIIRHVEEVMGNVAKTCRYYGVSRTAYYRWLKRYEKYGEEGLRDRSKKPHYSPKTTKLEVVEKTIYLRKNYHFGPLKIKMYLERYHDILITTNGVWRILKRLGLNRLPSSQRCQKHYLWWKT